MNTEAILVLGIKRRTIRNEGRVPRKLDAWQQNALLVCAVIVVGTMLLGVT